MKVCEYLVNWSRTHKNTNSIVKRGNHKCKCYENGKIEYIYFSTAIATVLPDGNVNYTHGGYYTSSTTRAINAYKNLL